MAEWINENLTIGEICENPEFALLKDLIFTNMDDEKWNTALGRFGVKKGDLIESLRYAADRARDEKDMLISYYTDEEKQEDPHKNDTCLINFALHKDAPYVMLCPGGGYNREWVLTEGYPIAKKLNELGINAFILIYRAGHWGLLPEPIDDLARAVDYIEKHKTELGVSTDNYALYGASAGGHLITEWGTKQKGYEHYGMKKPSTLLAAYPASFMSMFYDRYKDALDAGLISADNDIVAFMKRVGGENFTKDSVYEYSVDRQMDSDYPRTYIVHCMDDTTVPVEASIAFEKMLDKLGIEHEVHFPEKGEHGFGLGIGTDAEGWIDQAVNFLKRAY